MKENTNNNQQGEGLMREAGKLQPAARKLLEQVGNEEIKTLQIVRTPLSSFTKGFLNVISLGQFEKISKKYYDEMFHLSLWINGKYNLEKNEVVYFNTSNPRKGNSQVKNVSKIPSGVTIQQLIDNAIKRMGPENFSNYDAEKLNCQNFLINVLDGSKIGDSSDGDFIFQDASKIFKELPEYAKVLGKVSVKLGAIFNRLLYGEGKVEIVEIDDMTGEGRPRRLYEEKDGRLYFMSKGKKRYVKADGLSKAEIAKLNLRNRVKPKRKRKKGIKKGKKKKVTIKGRPLAAMTGTIGSYGQAPQGTVIQAPSKLVESKAMPPPPVLIKEQKKEAQVQPKSDTSEVVKAVTDLVKYVQREPTKITPPEPKVDEAYEISLIKSMIEMFGPEMIEDEPNIKWKRFLDFIARQFEDESGRKLNQIKYGKNKELEKYFEALKEDEEEEEPISPPKTTELSNMAEATGRLQTPRDLLKLRKSDLENESYKESLKNIKKAIRTGDVMPSLRVKPKTSEEKLAETPSFSGTFPSGREGIPESIGKGFRILRGGQVEEQDEVVKEEKQGNFIKPVCYNPLFPGFTNMPIGLEIGNPSFDYTEEPKITTTTEPKKEETKEETKKEEPKKEETKKEEPQKPQEPQKGEGYRSLRMSSLSFGLGFGMAGGCNGMTNCPCDQRGGAVIPNRERMPFEEDEEERMIDPNEGTMEFAEIDENQPEVPTEEEMAMFVRIDEINGRVNELYNQMIYLRNEFISPVTNMEDVRINQEILNDMRQLVLERDGIINERNEIVNVLVSHNFPAEDFEPGGFYALPVHQTGGAATHEEIKQIENDITRARQELSVLMREIPYLQNDIARSRRFTQDTSKPVRDRVNRESQLNREIQNLQNAQDKKEKLENEIKRLVNLLDEVQGFYENLLSGNGNEPDGLYNDEIEKIADNLGIEIPVIASDQIYKIVDMVNPSTKQFGFVINTDSSKGPGQHWRSVFIDNDEERPSIEYFDPLGDGPEPKLIEDMKDIIDKLGNEKYFLFKENMVKRQSDETETCGYFAVKFLEDRYNDVPFVEATGFKKCMDQSGEGEKEIMKSVKKYDSFL